MYVGQLAVTDCPVGIKPQKLIGLISWKLGGEKLLKDDLHNFTIYRGGGGEDGVN